MILDEEQKARELEQEIALMQGEGPYNLQRGPPRTASGFLAKHTGRRPIPPAARPYHTPSCCFLGNQLSRRAKSFGSVAPSVTLASQLQGRYLPLNTTAAPTRLSTS
jgi:hypothetical protein